MSEIPWVTVWGFGASVSATKNTLIVTQNGKTTHYPLDEISHLLIAGGHNLQTSAVIRLRERDIPVSFFDAHGKPLGTLSTTGEPELKARQKNLPAHKFALSLINASIDTRMILLHELSGKREGGIFYKGELEILTKTQDELKYLVTMQEFWRVFSLNKNMYYEILSRAVPERLGYRRLKNPPYTDPVNVLFSIGYSVLYADAAVACRGAGLDLSTGALFGSIEPCKSGACVYDIIEAAKPTMVDRVVLDLASEGAIEKNYETGARCFLSDELLSTFYKRLMKSVSRTVLEDNVKRYADAVKGLCDPVFRF